MAQFRYSAKDMAGKVHRGTLEAATEKALQEELTEQGLFLINAKNLTEAKGHKRLKPKQLADFCRELSTLLASGVSLVRALDIISGQEGIPGSEREIYQAVLLDLRKGISLSEAMEARGCFPELMLGMIRSGEGSGNLDQVAERLSIQYEKEYKLSQQVRSAMTYPAILLILSVVVVILIVTFILPQFQTLFDQMDSLPRVTLILMGISDFLVKRWYLAILGLLAMIAVIRLIVGIPGVRRQIDYRKVHMPGFGRLFKVIYTARFARTLSSLYSSGMPIAQAIGIAGKTVGNTYVEEQFDMVVTQVRSGIALSRALHEVDGFLLKLSSTILVGEESGQLDVMLDSIAATLEEDAEQATKRMVTLLEPILIICMAVVVGFIMIAVMLPIYQSYAAIENA
ncbi:type II secretion system F family protein [Anaerosacchariphilus sp. NSJ-68]|uniref:Type II secretion system F family protein n=2 Tax=Lachnospiraceae TaxID=186803 RepID=A0A923L9Y7_9FIRM|nr:MULTISPECIES: type II secretion system F family protein [Lachnospiraceae]MBC5658609.1 type II secretion system F family protein [Anaerosacchariphilus hominis]MBC5698182.1 type II secretion system F family protein [Roseburia difficilis]